MPFEAPRRRSGSSDAPAVAGRVATSAPGPPTAHSVLVAEERCPWSSCIPFGRRPYRWAEWTDRHCSGRGDSDASTEFTELRTGQDRLDQDQEQVCRTGDINTLARANVHAANLAGRVINISRVSCMPVTKPCRSGRAGSYAAVDRDVVIVGWPWPSGDAGPASSRIWNTTDCARSTAAPANGVGAQRIQQSLPRCAGQHQRRCRPCPIGHFREKA